MPLTTDTISNLGEQHLQPPPANTSSLASKDVTKLSTNYLQDHSKGEGALSVVTHEKQMAQVEELVRVLVREVKGGASDLARVMKDFMQVVKEENKKIQEISAEVVLRYKARTISGDEVQNARAINAFIGEGVKLQYENAKLAISVTQEGASAIHDKTRSAMVTILEIRTSQVTLMTAKLTVFYQQEKHNLDLILKSQTADLELQKEQFSQFEKIVHMLQTEKDANQKRYLEAKKQEMEQVIQLRGQFLKEEEVRNKLELDLAAHELEVKKVANKQKIDEKTLKIGKEIEQSKIRSAEIIQKQQAQLKAQTDKQQIDSLERTAANNAEAQKQLGMHQANVGLAGKIVDAGKPACVVM